MPEHRELCLKYSVQVLGGTEQPEEVYFNIKL